MFDIISLIVINIIPLYILIALGFISGRWLEVNLPSMATIAIYILAPAVNFGAMAQLKFYPEHIFLPFLFFGISAFIGFISYQTAKKVWKDSSANLIGMGSVSGNTMYFGLPIILALLGPEWVGVYALINLGLSISEISLGYFIGARGEATVKGAIIKVLKLPTIHAIYLGLLYNYFNLPLPVTFLTYWNYCIGAWIIIGMMIIGVALSKQQRLELDIKLLVSMFIPKFILWPMFGFVIVLLDRHFFHLYSLQTHLMLVIFTAVPLAGNLAAYAATLKLHPERAATAVLISTLLGIFTVPLAVILLKLMS